MQNTKPKSAKETKTQNQAMTTENERNPYMKIENQSQCETHVLINTKKKKVKTETRENLGEVDNEVSELGVQASLLLKPIGNGFANGFESEGSQLHHW